MERRRRPPKDPTIQALLRFVRVLETADDRARRAAICWLADKYLGVQLYGRVVSEDVRSTSADAAGSPSTKGVD
jgi:hypothetical protein